MSTLIFGLVLALLAAYLVVSHLRLHRRDLDKAVAYVVSSLGSPRQDNHLSEVVLIHALPLSDHMVKDIAHARGYRFVAQTSRHSNAALQFKRRDGKRRKLSIDD